MMDQFKMMGALAGLMKNQDRLKELAEDLKHKLGELRVTAETGGGAVRATASGHMRIISIEIDQAMLAGFISADRPDDRMLAEDLIAGAVNAALERAQEAAQQVITAAMSELGLPSLPPGLTGLLGAP
ncbi:MAG: YbaB/EbfC family nucleoid-associated protein [Phycisphaerales bacterium]|nr:YbaB/EbfC family nucleoid-associated protein [Phycisphaerales bacterium]